MPEQTLPDWMDEVDIVLTLEPMTEAEAKALGVPLKERHQYVRLAQCKGPKPDAA